MSRFYKVIRLFALSCLSFAIHASTSTNPTQRIRPLPIPPKAQTNAAPLPRLVTGKPIAQPLSPRQLEANKSPIIVLSIDGASVRGIAQFELLLALEERVNLALAKVAQNASGTKKFQYQRMSITEIFDFFAGTSAGSVNVGAILIPKDYNLTNTPQHINVPKFTLDELKLKLPDTLRAAFSTSTFRKLRTLQVPGVGGLLGSKFTAGPFEKLLQEYTGEARMSDLVKPAIITSYDLRSREIMNFSTYDACLVNPGEDVTQFQPQRNRDFYRKDKNVYIWQAVRASSAAPVYFKPLELEIGGKQRALIDAGLFIMSPTLLAWVETQKMYPDRPLIVISISSGALKEDRKVKTQGATAGSIPKVLKPTIETALEGQQALTDLMMRDIPNIKYHRLTFDVKSKEFDDASEENIKSLEASAKVTIASPQFQIAINDIVNAILERKEKLKRNPADFTPFVCTAKKSFKQNLDLGQSTDKKKANISKALQKMEIASGKMGTPNEQGKRMVEFSNSKKDQELKKKAEEEKQACQILLSGGKTKTPSWTTQNCNHVLSTKDICDGLIQTKARVELDMSNQCQTVRERLQKSCRNLSATLKEMSKELKSKKCR